MKRCKITVVGSNFLGDLAERYAYPGLGPCKMHAVGQVFHSNGWQKPPELCDNAWKSMQEYVMTLSHGGGDFYGDWMNDKRRAVVCCNDGLRPVSFEIVPEDFKPEGGAAS
jgi:uncharacterized repeat protein (TIGR04076 family)